MSVKYCITTLRWRLFTIILIRMYLIKRPQLSILVHGLAGKSLSNFGSQIASSRGAPREVWS